MTLNDADEQQRRGLRPPASKMVKVVATVVIGVTILGLVFDRGRDPNGTLLVQADGNDVRISILQNGKAVVTSSDKRSFTLIPGDYEVVADDAPRERLAVHVRRRARSVVTIKARLPADRPDAPTGRQP